LKTLSLHDALPIFDLDDGFDLNGSVEWQGGHADGDARMLATLSQYLGEKVGSTVAHQMLVGKGRARGDIDADLHQSADLFEIAKRCLGLSKHIDGAQTCGFLPRCRIEIAPQQACNGYLSVLHR